MDAREQAPRAALPRAPAASGEKLPRSAKPSASRRASACSTRAGARRSRAASAATVSGPEPSRWPRSTAAAAGSGSGAPRAASAAGSATSGSKRASGKSASTAARCSVAHQSAPRAASRRARRGPRARARAKPGSHSARGRDDDQREQRVVQLVGVARRRRAPPRAPARSPRDRGARDRAPSRAGRGAATTARVRRSSSGASSRNVNGRPFRISCASGEGSVVSRRCRLTPPDSIAPSRSAERVHVHRLVQAIVQRLAHERVIGDLDRPGLVLLALREPGEDRRHQVVGLHALDRRRVALAAAHAQHRERAARGSSASAP